MCPKTQSLYLAIIVVIIVYYFVYKHILYCVTANFDTLAALVNSSQRVISFSQMTFTGFYKSRRLEFRCSFFDKSKPRQFYIEPKTDPGPQKLFLFDYPRPTRNTKLIGDKIVFSRTEFFNTKGFYRIYSREELVQILEELTEAAHNVETGISYKSKGHANQK